MAIVNSGTTDNVTEIIKIIIIPAFPPTPITSRIGDITFQR
jgi:hypothetical protein